MKTRPQPMPVNEEAVAHKVEFVIMSILVHYKGYYQDSLVQWYSALRLGVPQLKDTQQLWDVFRRLSDGGIIDLRRLNSESSRRNEGNHDGVFVMKPFMTTLTPMGLDRWNTVRTQPH